MMPVVMKALLQRRLKLKQLYLDGLLVIDPSTVSSVKKGAFAYLEELSIGTHSSSEFTFKPFIFSLVNCSRLRKLSIGTAISYPFPNIKKLTLHGIRGIPLTSLSQQADLGMPADPFPVLIPLQLVGDIGKYRNMLTSALARQMHALIFQS